jgi:hypothetical protein
MAGSASTWGQFENFGFFGQNLKHVPKTPKWDKIYIFAGFLLKFQPQAILSTGKGLAETVLLCFLHCTAKAGNSQRCL